MKMKQEHFTALQSALEKVLKIFPDIQRTYKRQGFSKERFAWDLLWDSKFDTSELYTYLNDSHIQTALFKIIGDY